MHTFGCGAQAIGTVQLQRMEALCTHGALMTRASWDALAEMLVKAKQLAALLAVAKARALALLAAAVIAAAVAAPAAAAAAAVAAMPAAAYHQLQCIQQCCKRQVVMTAHGCTWTPCSTWQPA